MMVRTDDKYSYKAYFDYVFEKAVKEAQNNHKDDKEYKYVDAIDEATEHFFHDSTDVHAIVGMYLGYNEINPQKAFDDYNGKIVDREPTELEHEVLNILQHLISVSINKKTSSMRYVLTDIGLKCIENYIAELNAKRKEILDAGKDTAIDTQLPRVCDIICDVKNLGVDEDGEYYNGWPVTDNYDADYPLLLKVGRDLREMTTTDIFNEFHEYKDAIDNYGKDLFGEDLHWSAEFRRISGVSKDMTDACYMENEEIPNDPDINVKLLLYLDEIDNHFKLKMSLSEIYAVSQSHCGHEYVWIFDEKGLSENCPDFDRFKEILAKGEEIWEDILWPMGGSNSSATCIRKLDNLEDARIFLAETCDGPDLEDPTLCDIAEYIRTVDVEEGSITQKILDHYGLDAKDLEKTDPRYDELIKAGIAPEDFYGDKRDVRYSEIVS